MNTFSNTFTKVSYHITDLKNILKFAFDFLKKYRSRPNPCFTKWWKCKARL